MKIVKIASQNRRDIYGTVECEGCGANQKFAGYDDDNYHRNVVPDIGCKACGKSARDMGVETRPLGTKYPADQVV